MGGIPGQIHPTAAERIGHAALQSDPRGPRKLGDLHAQSRLVQQRLHLGRGDRGAELTGRRLNPARGPGGEQAPRRSLTEAEGEDQAPPPSCDTGGVAGEMS